MMQKLKANEHIYLTDSVLRALSQNRITTIVEFLQEDVTKLTVITKLNLPEILTVRDDIYEKYSAPTINGTNLLDNNLYSKINICTGLERLDELLEGGIPIGYITELCGLADSGKTQLCLQLAINCVKNSECSVLYVDTKGDFSAVRIQKILEASGLQHKEMALIMYKIKIVRVWTLEEAIELLKNVKNNTINITNLAMIIVDSLPCLMFQYLGDENKIGFTMLNTFVNYSRYLCKERQICMINVNIQTRWVDQDVANIYDDEDADTTNKEIYKERKIRSLGKYWRHIPYLILSLERLQDNFSKELNNEKYLITVMKCNNLKKQLTQCKLHINSSGVT